MKLLIATAYLLSSSNLLLRNGRSPSMALAAESGVRGIIDVSYSSSCGISTPTYYLLQNIISFLSHHIHQSYIDRTTPTTPTSSTRLLSVHRMMVSATCKANSKTTFVGRYLHGNTLFRESLETAPTTVIGSKSRMEERYW